MVTHEHAAPAYASLGRRFLAEIIDIFILVIPYAAAEVILPPWGWLAIWFLYAPIFESSEIRATLGKYLLGLQVVGPTGARLSLKFSTLRNFLKLLFSFLFLIEFLVALFSKKSQTLHDIMANTLVVNGKSDVAPIEAWRAVIKDLLNSPIEPTPTEKA